MGPPVVGLPTDTVSRWREGRMDAHVSFRSPHENPLLLLELGKSPDNRLWHWLM